MRRSASTMTLSDFLKIAKEDADETKSRKGTKNESYTVLPVENSIRLVTINYIPGSPSVTLFQGLRQAKKQFGLSIINASEPKFKFFAPSCIVGKEPETVINGKDGFKDYEFEIRCSESSQVWE